MRAITMFYLLFPAIAACGGVTAVDKPTVGSQSPSSAGAGSVPRESPTVGQIQVVDDVDHAGGQYPILPPGSSSFFWRGGLGNWFVSSSDGSSRDASIDEVIPPRGDSHKAYHVTETTPGTVVDLWAQLNHPQGTGIDLSSYAVVSFWARMIGPGSELTVAFGVNGQFSKLNAAAFVSQKVVSLSDAWTQFIVRFDDVNLDRKSVSSIDFVVDGPSEPLDLWVDDLGFLCQGSCP